MSRIKLMEVVIPCLRYGATKSFYENVLGFVPTETGRHHTFFDAGGAQLALVDASQGDIHVRPTGHGLYLDLSHEHLTRIKSLLQANATPIIEERNDQFGRAITFRDPEGNLLNVFQEGTF